MREFDIGGTLSGMDFAFSALRGSLYFSIIAADRVSAIAPLGQDY